MPTVTTAAAIRAVLGESLEQRDDLVLIGESEGGVAGTTEGLREQFGDERVLRVPVADRAAAGLAVGLALGGRTAVVEITASGRLTALLEVLAEAASVADGGEFGLPLVVRVPYGTEAGDRVDRPLGDLLAGVPGLSVVCASSPATAAGLLRAALDTRRPTVILEPRVLYRDRGEVGADPLPLGTARLVREGADLTLATWGAGVQVALEAAEQVQGDLSAEVIDLLSLAPLDTATLGEHLRRTGRIVTVHPDDDALAERVLRVGLHEAFLYLESPPAAARDDIDAVATAARDSVFY